MERRRAGLEGLEPDLPLAVVFVADRVEVGLAAVDRQVLGPIVRDAVEGDRAALVDACRPGRPRSRAAAPASSGRRDGRCNRPWRRSAGPPTVRCVSRVRSGSSFTSRRSSARAFAPSDVAQRRAQVGMALGLEQVEAEGGIRRREPGAVVEPGFGPQQEAVGEPVGREPHRPGHEPVEGVGLVERAGHQRVEDEPHAGRAVAAQDVDVQRVEGREVLVERRRWSARPRSSRPSGPRDRRRRRRSKSAGRPSSPKADRPWLSVQPSGSGSGHRAAGIAGQGRPGPCGGRSRGDGRELGAQGQSRAAGEGSASMNGSRRGPGDRAPSTPVHYVGFGGQRRWDRGGASARAAQNACHSSAAATGAGLRAAPPRPVVLRAARPRPARRTAPAWPVGPRVRRGTGSPTRRARRRRAAASGRGPRRRARGSPPSISSTMAAFCCVTWSIWLTAVLTWPSAVACSRAEAAISPTIVSISATWPPSVAERRAGLAHEGDALFDLRARGRDQALDLFRGIGRALRQRPHLGRHDREAPAGVAGPRRLDAGVERQEVGLEGDLVDHPDDLADLARRTLDAAHGFDGLARRHGPIARRRLWRPPRPDWAWVAPSADLRTVAVICVERRRGLLQAAACCSVRRDRSSAAAPISVAPRVMADELSATFSRVPSSVPAVALKSRRSVSNSAPNGSSMRATRSPAARRFSPAASAVTTCIWTRAASAACRSRADALGFGGRDIGGEFHDAEDVPPEASVSGL